MAIAKISTFRSVRMVLRTTKEQELKLRIAAEAIHKSLDNFILDSACLAAEQTLLEQRTFVISDGQFQFFLDVLDQPEQSNLGLQRLFSRKAPWNAP
jgi:uncharacterized protein (DUF1778 family)